MTSSHTTQYGHRMLSTDQLDQFVGDPQNRCPECGQQMTQKQNPIRGSDSWWFTCPNRHGLWVGK